MGKIIFKINSKKWWKFSQVNENLNLTDQEYTEFEKEYKKHNKTRHMYFEPDTHFYNLEVNTTHSSVHVPTNVSQIFVHSKMLIENICRFTTKVQKRENSFNGLKFSMMSLSKIISQIPRYRGNISEVV